MPGLFDPGYRCTEVGNRSGLCEVQWFGNNADGKGKGTMTLAEIAVMILVGILAFLLGRATQQTKPAPAEADQHLMDKIQVVAAQTVSESNRLFMETAADKIEPLIDRARQHKDSVTQLVEPLSAELRRMENARAEAQGALKQQLEALAGHNRELVDETRTLSNALQRPEVRGAWGEMQLHRVVELAGMKEYCDFQQQVSVELADGNRDRPDMVVYLPNRRTIIVDAKAPLQAYLEAVNAPSDQEREEALDRVAQQVDKRARELAGKKYWDSFKQTPDFVVMFLPGEFLLPMALERNPGLMDRIAEQNVVIATPNILIALLKTVAMGWQEVTLAQEAKKIEQLGKELYNKLYTFASHMQKTQKSLQGTVKNFNASIATLDGRNSAFDHARRFTDLGIQTNKEIPVVDEVRESVKELKILADPAAARPQDGSSPVTHATGD